MKQITIRGIPDEVAKVIEREARKSRNKVVISLLEEATGVPTAKLGGVKRHHDLDHLSGSWSREEAARFERHLRRQRKFDEELWK